MKKYSKLRYLHESAKTSPFLNSNLRKVYTRQLLQKNIKNRLLFLFNFEKLKIVVSKNLSSINKKFFYNMDKHSDFLFLKILNTIYTENTNRYLNRYFKVKKNFLGKNPEYITIFFDLIQLIYFFNSYTNKINISKEGDIIILLDSLESYLDILVANFHGLDSTKFGINDSGIPIYSENKYTYDVAFSRFLDMLSTDVDPELLLVISKYFNLEKDFENVSSEKLDFMTFLIDFAKRYENNCIIYLVILVDLDSKIKSKSY